RAQLLAEVGVVGERARGAVDVELGVRARVAAVRDREPDELVAVGMDRARQRPQQLAPLGEGHPAERRAAALARVRQRAADVAAGELGDRLLGRRVDEGRARGSFAPFADEEAAHRHDREGYAIARVGCRMRSYILAAALLATGGCYDTYRVRPDELPKLNDSH